MVLVLNIFTFNSKAEIVYIDINFILNSSEVGKNLNNYIESIKNQNSLKYEQIESELISNSWMTLRTDSNFIFDESVSNKWNDAYDLLGVDPNKLSQFSGSS